MPTRVAKWPGRVRGLCTGAAVVLADYFRAELLASVANENPSWECSSVDRLLAYRVWSLKAPS